MSTITAVHEQTIRKFLDELGAKSPTPGGGAVAGVTAAIAASLTRMVVNYSIGRRALAEHEPFHRECLNELESLEKQALELAEEDAKAYGRLNALWKLDEGDPKRQAEWTQAVLDAIDMPRRVMQVCLDLVHMQIRLVPIVNVSLKSDLAIAGILAHSAAQAAMWNVRVNLPHVLDNDKRIEQEVECEMLVGRVEINRNEIEEACARDVPL